MTTLLILVLCVVVLWAGSKALNLLHKVWRASKQFIPLVQQCVVGKKSNFLHSRRRASCEGFSWNAGEGLLRTAVRNMLYRGIPVRVAMTISDQKREAFWLYKIVGMSDLHEAAKKLAQQDQERDLQPI